MREPEWEELFFVVCLRCRIRMRRSPTFRFLGMMVRCLPWALQMASTLVDRLMNGANLNDARSFLRRSIRLDWQLKMLNQRMDELEADAMEEAADTICAFGLRIGTPEYWDDK